MIMITKRIGNLLTVERAGLLVVAAAPGIQRLAFVFIMSALVPVASVGLVMADLGVASFLSLLAGGTLSAQVMALWAALPDPASRRRVGAQLLAWQASAIVVVAPLTWLLWTAGLIESPGSVFLFFLGFSIWQTERSKLLCDRRVVALLAIECCLTSLAAVSALLGERYALAAYGGAMLVTGLAVMLTSRLGIGGVDGIEGAEGLNHRETAMLAMNGIVSTGRDLLMVPAIRWVAGSATAGLAAQVLTAMTALLLLPRTLSYHYMPSLSRQMRGGLDDGESVLDKYRHSMTLTLSGIGAALAAGVFAAWSSGVAAPKLLVIALAGATLIAGQASLVSASVLMVRQSVRPIMMSALWTTLVWALVVLALGVSGPSGLWSAQLLLLVAVVLSMLRAFYLRGRADASVDTSSQVLAQDNS